MRIEVGRIYHYEFRTADGRLRHEGEWAVDTEKGQTAKAFRCYIMRFTHHDDTVATITEVAL